ncbi:TPA: transcriptional regulator [Aeromonas dhakensis]|uniref:Mor transcription activator family protein n=1 Tax=Aeromonas dhakensis TaxID=196024 RepID=UPI0020B2E18B|nr:Mor transcription activator family protein [Aeromonas dhakensis]CAD7510660.1 DNA-binding protein [Aeromonas dhakensis]CAD7524396.1 DNA-binding protein [Aeromonas dhakensis]HDX8448050.1 transcriptional regulator [Aeromonas dhakensis]HDX8517226.1 transcriptional regulator [Aeromonas dhakensis]HDX9005251.1 transcriptional regulator [Aeromonas dhakensis]
MEQNQDLFADDHASLGQLVDRLDQIPASELTAKWPKALSELVDVLACELVRGGMVPEQAKAQARKLALVQAHYMGGRAYYIPTGEHLKAALRDRAIWDEFNGRNIDQLARKHGLSVPQTYAVVAEQRELTKRRYQPDLFGT